MNYILNLTNNCNLACKYCYVNKDKAVMDFKTIKKAVGLASQSKGIYDILFFGGEPLLYKDLIYQTIEYCKYIEEKSDCRFSFSLNTNGTLLDEEFLIYSLKNKILIGISIDGVEIAHNSNRVDLNGAGTFSTVSKKADLLLEAEPYALALTVVNPDTVEYFSDSIEFLINKGFRYLLCGLNYSAKWNNYSLIELEKQYKKISKIYYKKLAEEKNLHFSPFDLSISSYINKKNICQERCELGLKQISIGTDGRIYPCIQFSGDPDFVIGDVDRGINREKQSDIFKMGSTETKACSVCAINKRCNYNCGCINKASTGRIDRVSPVLCQNERLLIPIVDKLAEKLYKNKVPMFIQKYYNDLYPLISCIENVNRYD